MTSEYVNLHSIFEAVVGRMPACLKKIRNLHVMLLLYLLNIFEGFDATFCFPVVKEYM
jgi:hypothetical protein